MSCGNVSTGQVEVADVSAYCLHTHVMDDLHVMQMGTFNCS